MKKIPSEDKNRSRFTDPTIIEVNKKDGKKIKSKKNKEGERNG